VAPKVSCSQVQEGTCSSRTARVPYCSTTKASHINGLSDCGPRPYLHARSRWNMHVPYCLSPKASHINGLSDCWPRSYLHARSRWNMPVPYCSTYSSFICSFEPVYPGARMSLTASSRTAFQDLGRYPPFLAGSNLQFYDPVNPF